MGEVRHRLTERGGRTTIRQESNCSLASNRRITVPPALHFKKYATGGCAEVNPLRGVQGPRLAPHSLSKSGDRRCTANDSRYSGPTFGANALAMPSNAIAVVQPRLGSFLDVMVLVHLAAAVEIDPFPTVCVPTVDSGRSAAEIRSPVSERSVLLWENDTGQFEHSGTNCSLTPAPGFRIK